jgi:hypothetical protein
MKQVYLLKSSDEWHSTSSERLIGVYSSRRNAIKAAKIYNGIGTSLSNDIAYKLEEQNQTQGLEINFSIEITNLNEFNL